MADDDKPNVIPFGLTWPHYQRRPDLGEPADLTKASLDVLLKSIDFYGFESEAGPLENCAEWMELRRRLRYWPK